MAGMFGPRLNTVFASRWKALWWASGVLLTAYCSVPSPEDTAQPATHPAAKHVKVDPWAVGSGKSGGRG
jgi:hypothetical protein